MIACQVGRSEIGVDYIRQALVVRPDFPQAHSNLGNALRDLGKLDEAVSSYRETLRLQPGFAETHSNLGNVLKEQGKLDEAVSSYRQALRIKPDLLEAHLNLASACSSRAIARKPPPATGRLRVRPDHAETHHRLVAVLMEQWKLPAAVSSLQEAVRLKPDYADAYTTLGNVLIEQGKLDEAAAAHEQALRLNPSQAMSHASLGMIFLFKGDFERGWADYEWRWKCKEFNPPTFPQPLWDGSPLQGRTLFLQGEQGLGDTLQFIRYAPLVQERGGRVLLGCHSALVRLLAACPGVDRVLPPDSQLSLSEFDVYAPLMSLPAVLNTSLAALPAKTPYLFPDAGLVDHWKEQLRSFTTFKIGIAWQGNPNHPRDRARSIPLASFAPLGGLDGVQLFSLQQGGGERNRCSIRASGSPSSTSGASWKEASGDFMDSARSSRTWTWSSPWIRRSPTWPGRWAFPSGLRLSLVPDWRWMWDREDSPWYPTMRLFRQSRQATGRRSSSGWRRR